VNRRSVASSVSALGDREVQITLSTAERGRDGHVLQPAGCVLTNFRRVPVILWSHMTDEPVGTASSIVVGASAISARATFAAAGVSPTADRVCGLVKDGVVRGVSIGFEIIEGTPIDPSHPRAGLNVSAWELLEVSFCSVPVDVGATVTARAIGGGAHAASALTPDARALVAAAAERGEVLTALRAAVIVREARQLGRTPAYHYAYQCTAADFANRETSDYLRRQRVLRELA
jgi:HK97 family phage prohead protease